jgi:hypothetical protein
MGILPHFRCCDYRDLNLPDVGLRCAGIHNPTDSPRGVVVDLPMFDPKVSRVVYAEIRWTSVERLPQHGC